MNDNHGRPVGQELPCGNSRQALTLRQQICENHLEVIEWTSQEEGFVKCPGEEHHTTRTERAHCKVYLNGAPTVDCFHESCSNQIENANRRLRGEINAQEILGRNGKRSNPDRPASIGTPKTSKEIEALKVAAKRSKDIILDRHACTMEELVASSPYRIPEGQVEQFALQLATLPPDAIVFNGGLRDSGEPCYAANFVRVSELIERRSILGEYISQSSFPKGCYERKKTKIKKRLIFTVEADSIDDEVERKLKAGESLTDDDKRRNKEKSCAVYRWLQHEVGLKLLTVVDSGSKSLHASFVVPPEDYMAQLKHILPALGCDQKMMGGHQITRAAGARRDGTGPIQALLYCDPTSNQS